MVYVEYVFNKKNYKKLKDIPELEIVIFEIEEREIGTHDSIREMNIWEKYNKAQRYGHFPPGCSEAGELSDFIKYLIRRKNPFEFTHIVIAHEDKDHPLDSFNGKLKIASMRFPYAKDIRRLYIAVKGERDILYVKMAVHENIETIISYEDILTEFEKIEFERARSFNDVC